MNEPHRADGGHRGRWHRRLADAEREHRRDAGATTCYFTDSQVWLFRQILIIAKRWLAECVKCKDIVEISGQEPEQKEAKVETAAKLWVPAVNAEGTFGRWAFLEIDDPWDAQNTIREFLARVGG